MSDISETVKEHESEIKSLHEELATVKESNEILEELQAKLRSSADEVTELNGQVSAYAEELRGTKEREAEQTQKLQAGALELVAKDEKIQELMVEKESIQELLKTVQETKEAQDTSFEALKTRTSHVSLEHVATMEKARLLEENNTKLQEEMDRVVEERKSVDEMMIRMGSKEQELQLELQQEKETVKELSENWDKRGLEIEALEKEKTELRGAIDELEKKVEEGNSEMNHKLEFLQSQLEEMETEKEEIKKAKSVLEAEVVENRGELQKISQEKETLKEERKKRDETVAAEEASHEAEMEGIMLARENLSTEVARLENELKTEMESKNTLAQSVSQLITDTNALKNQLRQEQANKEKQKEADAAQEKEKDELQGHLMQAKARTKELESKVEAGALLEEKLTKVQQELLAYEAKYNSMQAELATSEIKNSDLEQTLEGKGEEVSNALAEQKERYDKRHKEVIAAQAKKWQGKMKEFCEIANKKVTDAEEKLAAAESKVKGQESELKSICVSNERLKKMVERMEEAEKLSEKEKEMLETRYTKAREDGKILLAKYERQKEATAKAAEQASEQNEVVTIRQELIRVKSENRTLSNQLSYADTRLREIGRHKGFGTSKRSRESISVPGRVTRQTSSRDSEDSGVFKLPGSSQGTPGRTRTSRTVSDTRMARTRPPIGSGSLFHADEEVGEVFSSSYLSDLKEGNCLLDDTGRMSELARRNTLAPAHLKSAYPIESQFFDDNSMTEESIRHSRLPMRQSIRLSTVPGNQTTSFSSGAKAPLNLSALPADTSRELAGVNSPAVNRLSQATSSMSLDSPSTATRSKRTLSNLSTADLPAKKRVPPPTAFTIDAPKPGNAVRKSKVTKQPCTQEHGTKKQVCEAPHPTNDEESHATPQPRRSGRRSGELATQEDSQQDATFVRDTTRASKRSNVSYMKPGPPTPGRNKSLESNTSLEFIPADVTSPSSSSSGTPRSKRSTTSLAKSLKTPLLDSTNQSTSTPGTANKSTSKFKVKGMTPLNIKKAIGAAFRSKGLKNKSSTYQLMKKQDQTIDRDQSKSKGVKVTTPMKAKERLGKSPRTMHK